MGKLWLYKLKRLEPFVFESLAELSSAAHHRITGRPILDRGGIELDEDPLPLVL